MLRHLRPGRDQLKAAVAPEVGYTAVSLTQPRQQPAVHRPSDASLATAAGSAADAGDDEAPDPPLQNKAERELGLVAMAAAIIVLAALAATLSTLPMTRDAADPSVGGAAPTMTIIPGLPAFSPAPEPSARVSTAPTPVGRPVETNAALVGSSSGPPATAEVGVVPRLPQDPPATARAQPTTAPVPAITLPPEIESAIGDLRAAIQDQVGNGRLTASAGADLRGKVDQVAREVSEEEWARARYYASRIRDKLGKYRDDGLLTAAGYQILIARLDVLDHTLA